MHRDVVSQSLADWLERIERIHPRAIEMGLSRVSQVRDAMGLSLSCPVITVGGTNGKGSVCALLESMLGAAAHRVGLYTSPHLVRYNERVRIGGREADDDALIGAFERVDAARGSVPLTYFEFGTLAAVDLFSRAAVDVAVLEVGLGGRLDAVNAFDPDCAGVASVRIDHTAYLGSTRDSIGREKAGIFRADRPAICGDEDPPGSLTRHARDIGADLRVIARDFGYRTDSPVQWQYWSGAGRKAALPYPALRGEFQLANASTALAALEAVRERLPVDMGAVRRGLLEVMLPGRFQVLPGRPQVVLDVAHNPQAAARLAQTLAAMPRAPATLAVFGMLADKDIAAVAEALRPVVDQWIICPLDSPRSAGIPALREALAGAGVAAAAISAADSVTAALRMARDRACQDDRILAFGSFYTVSGVLQATHPR